MLDLHTILNLRLDGTVKGFPQTAPSVLVKELAQLQLNLFEDLDCPVAVLKQSAIEHNSSYLREFLARSGVSLCPHGKTTMAPQLFDLQLRDGAWGISVATPQQARVCLEFGVPRIFLANQLVSEPAARFVFQALAGNPQLEFYCLLDSFDNLAQLERVAAVPKRKLRVLIELGYSGGRTGVRDLQSAITLAERVKHSTALELAGVECYEGLLVSADAEADARAVRQLLATLCELAQILDARQLFATPEIILSAGGSAYFDLVAETLSQMQLSRPCRSVLRSGCYLTHDSGFYERLLQKLALRGAFGTARLLPALEVWGVLQSRPERHYAYLTLGKRDASYDIDLPSPTRWFRKGQTAIPELLPAGYRISGMNDQHARLELPEGSDLRVGDFVGVGVSHPCSTFDRYAYLFLVNDAYQVQSAIKTFF